jgi:hypothetical protein
MDEPVAVSIPEAVMQIQAAAQTLGISPEPTLAFLNLKSSTPMQATNPVVADGNGDLSSATRLEPSANRARTSRNRGRRDASKEAAVKAPDRTRAAQQRLFVVSKPQGAARTSQALLSHRVSAWERFIKDKQLQQRYNITHTELGMLSRVAMMGEAQDTQDFLFILDKIRGNRGPAC